MSNSQQENLHFRQTWQKQLAQAFTEIEAFCHYLKIEIKELPVSTLALENFALRVPLSFASNIEKGNVNDPLLRQVLPVVDELNQPIHFSLDPVGDLLAQKHPGVLHKYQGRVLLINTGSCAIHCRYCFRRNFPYQQTQLSRQKQQQALEMIANDPSIGEVILSGGDPLLLSDERLAELFEALSTIDHVKRIRIHSRLAIVLPARITANLLAKFANSRQQIIMVTHANHANELDQRVQQACQSLHANGVILLNQSVLLKGVNDDIDTLCHLSERLFFYGVHPYYLHLLDRAIGTAHFEVDQAQAISLHGQLKARLPGYLVPRLVYETAGGMSKEWLS